MGHKKIKDNKICVCCGIYCRKFLCHRHKKNYIYQKDYNVVVLRYGRKVSCPQTKLYKLTRELFKKRTFQEVVFPWNLFYRYDIVMPDLNIILEYDGEHHVKFNKFFHKTRKNFERRKQIDKDKEILAKENGYKVVRFNNKEKINKYTLKSKVNLKL